MSDVIDDLIGFVSRVAGVNLCEVEDADDLQGFAASIGRAAFALGVLHERGEQRKKDMARWKDIGGGVMRLDVSAAPTVEEAARGEHNIREIIATRTPPGARPTWDPACVTRTTGLSYEQAEHLFPTKARWDAYLASAGKEEVGGSDLRDQGVKAPRVNKQAEEAAALDLIQQGMALLKETGRWDGKSATVNESVPLVQLPDDGSRNGNGNGVHLKAPDPTIREIAGDGRLEENPRAAVDEVPLNVRPEADTEDLGQALYQQATKKGLARSESRLAGKRF